MPDLQPYPGQPDLRLLPWYSWMRATQLNRQVRKKYIECSDNDASTEEQRKCIRAVFVFSGSRMRVTLTLVSSQQP